MHQLSALAYERHIYIEPMAVPFIVTIRRKFIHGTRVNDAWSANIAAVRYCHDSLTFYRQ